ncbi:dihydroxyacetone kinase subunit DhaL [Maribacter sp. SA7]|uniref:dihydroxyacetone kinase subunit DhaL n=1 Tax=Maribacter zhoushanensis TaxID=3030012 RepID=UPI0023EB6885|nr:dihydroxyacetone kinase subunit DhaL [Maribacter zhoushanensis]MDF4203834.1 dihydroxyacetone kinase subunit DhaL [Maribacter zhoushanensis]
METIKQAQVINWLEKTAHVIGENKDYLTKLDSDIGDADHGFNMERGFNKVLEKINELAASEDLQAVLKNTGMTLLSSIGGASGPLYGSFFLQAALPLEGKTELTVEDLANSFGKGVDGIKARGRASKGEKTMIDTLEPAIDALLLSVKNKDSIETALSNMLAAAEEGMKFTIDMIATKGRASYLGDRSIGHQDPGATSSFLILKTLKESIIQPNS